MRLIDADEVKRFYNEGFPTLDNGVHWSRNDIIMNLHNIPTVEAIPIEWVKRYAKKGGRIANILFPFEIEMMLEDWEVENGKGNTNS